MNEAPPVAASIPRIDGVRISTRARIPLLADGKQANFVEYELVFRKSDEDFERAVWCTYKQLNEIDNRLKKALKKFDFPSFPSRAFFRSETDAEFVETRRVGLEAYLQRVIPFCTGACEELDAFLASAEPKFDFSSPTRMIHASTVTIGGEEVWIGLVCDGLFEGLAFMTKLKFNFEELVSLEERLGLLELNHTRTEIMAETLESNLVTIRRVINVEGLPADTKLYFERLEGEAKVALKWARYVEPHLLATLDAGPPPVSALQTSFQGETPGAIEDVEYARMPSPKPGVNQVSLAISSSGDGGNDNNFPASPVAVAAAPSVAQAAETLSECVERADELMLEMAICQSVARQGPLVQAKKELLEHMSRLRERDGPDSSAAWNRAIVHVQESAAFCASVHDSIIRLESQLYELVDRRGRLNATSRRAECSAVRRGVISLRRLLRQVKETEFGGSIDDCTDPAARADFNRITDIQENAAQLQLDLENTFEFDSNMEDLMVDKMKQRVVETAAKEHEQAQSDIFEL